MGHTYTELRRMSVNELVDEYDILAEHVEPTAGHCQLIGWPVKPLPLYQYLRQL